MQETRYSMKFQFLKNFQWKKPNCCPQHWYAGNSIFCEFQLLIESPKKCAGRIAVIGRIPGYYPANKCAGRIAVTGRIPGYYPANKFFMNFGHL